MYLKSITLKGFKSFADRTRLVLEPGVAVIVGPNGSGKSNISDAVLWALGEQSAKSLRGNAMEDVIFAGSSARQPVGIAEVDLVLDNSEGTLPLEFHEITITRRMFRNGESEYLLNQSPVRLMDIQELLHDTGLGKDTPSIISQGRLEEVLNSKPEDRRALIEEAAGILKHKRRKDRALKRLVSMDVHVDRIRDVLAEIDRQLKPLQRQATKAAEHRELVEKLRELEIAIAVAELVDLQQQWEAVEKIEREHDAEVELARYRLQEKERELQKFQSLLEEKGLFVGDLSEQRRRLQSVLERLNSGLLLLEEKGKNLVERLSELRQKIHVSEARLQSRSGELQQIAEERAFTDARLAALYSQLNDLRKQAEAGKKERLAAEEALAAALGEQRRVRKEVDDARTELAKLQQALSTFTLERDMLVDRVTALRDQRSALAQTLSARRDRIEALTARLDRTRKEALLAESDVDKRVRLVESKRGALEEHRSRLAELRAEARALEEIDRAFASASPALAWLLQQQRQVPEVLGPLADFIAVDPEHERLVEHALGSDMFAVLLSSRDVVGSIVARLAEDGVGEYSLVPVDANPASCPEGPGVPLIDSIRCSDERARAALSALIGDVRVVDSVDEAIAASRSHPACRYTTKEGHIVWPAGKIAAGPMASQDAQVLSRKRRIAELSDEVAAAQAAVGEVEAELVAAEEALAAAQQDLLELSQALASLGADATAAREEIGRLEQSIADIDAEGVKIDLRLRQIEERTTKDRPLERQLNETIERGLARIEELEDVAAARRDERDLRFREESELAARLSECQVEIAAVSERQVHLKRRQASTLAELEELQHLLTQSRQTESALEVLRERVQPLHGVYCMLLERAEHWAERLRDRARFEQADSESLRSTIHEAQDAVREAQAALDELNERTAEVRVTKAQLEVRVKTAASKIVEELGIPLEAALKTEPVHDRAAAAEAAHRLRKRMTEIGPVNPIAVEEYQALKDRRDFLQTQLDDLMASRKALQRVVSAIDRKMRDRFLETFELVDKHFQDVFAVLFPGGKASLSLTDPDDPENTGIEVIAQPMGKRLQKMSLLSGGEKSLTASALLFALYRTRPCPFYILDEVDAALDDTNLRRFISFVDSMRAHTQFIIVTHQRRTMEMADVLYGVSMQADGVSKVVSQRLERSLRQAPSEALS